MNIAKANPAPLKNVPKTIDVFAVLLRIVLRGNTVEEKAVVSIV